MHPISTVDFGNVPKRLQWGRIDLTNFPFNLYEHISNLFNHVFGFLLHTSIVNMKIIVNSTENFYFFVETYCNCSYF